MEQKGTLQEQVDRFLIAGAKRKEILIALSGEYKKREIVMAINMSPITDIANVKIATWFMIFSVILGMLIGSMMGGGNSSDALLVLFITIICGGIFAAPYIATLLVFKYAKEEKIKKTTLIAITIYHILFLVGNIILGIVMKLGFGAGIIPIILTFSFVKGVKSWDKYVSLMEK